jgi:signal transduction histidine kinase
VQALRASEAALVHDLRNPLAAVYAVATLAGQRLQAEAPGELRDKLLQHVGVIADSTRRMEAIIQGVLELSRAGELLPFVEPIDLAQLLGEVAANEPAVDLVRFDVPEQVVAHPPSLERIFQNLFHNAGRYGSHGGPAGHYALVTVYGAETASGWRFTVQDDGPGVDEADIARLFQPWQRGAAARETGTGLGLSIVAAIVEQHGGTISVENAPEGGAVFTFTISRNPRVAPTEE